MDISALLGNNYFIGAVSGIGGVFLTLLTQQILNKRGLFTYSVNHVRVGVSADDAVFGSVRITWNGQAVPNLYSSTVELMNESIKDFENVVVRAFTNHTILLTERTEIVGTTRLVNWTDEFKKELEVAPGQSPSEAQAAMHSGRRDYLIPVMNRGQVVRFHFLNAAGTEKQPSIWLDVLHKGVRVRFRVPQQQVFGVAQPRAALVGAILGFVLVGIMIALTNTVWVAALGSLVYGFIAQVPGAWTVRACRSIRDSFRG